MSNITAIDKNFEVKNKISKENVKFYDVNELPFKLYGVKHSNGVFRRLPENIAKNTNEGVYYLHTNTAGGRVRFKTDSDYIAVYVKFSEIGRFSHFSLLGSAGMDLYVKENGTERYVNSFVPNAELGNELVSCIDLFSSDMREYTVNMPSYASVCEMFIGLDKNATVLPASNYSIEKPIVYYGSSITQGGCSSRPGNIYQNIIARRFDADYINLGFSGNAKGEEVMAEYISNLEMSVFVLDYDHNAPTEEHLLKTHENFFKIIRKNNPVLPVVFMSRPVYIPDNDTKNRYKIIKNTYDNAKASGDKNVYLIGGKELMLMCGNEGTVDNCHPNDFGFASMAKALGDVLEGILQ